MAKAIGVTFEVGAKTMGTVASTFATVESRISNLKGSLKSMQADQRRTAALMTANDRLQAARGAYKANPTEELKRELDIAARGFRTAQKALRGYGINIGNVVDHHRRLEDSINRSSAALARQQRLQANQARRGELRGQMFDTVAMAATVAMPVKLAVDFESSFADVKKVIDFASAEEEKAVQADIRALSVKTGLAAEGIAGIYAAAGSAKLATSREELVAFADTAATMAVAFGMTADEAGAKMASWRSKMGMSQTEVVALSDAINHLGNNMAADPLKTAEVVERMGSVAKGAGLTAKSIAALSASFVAASPSPEIAATGMKNFLLAMTKGESLSKTQQGALAKLGLGDPAQLAEAMQQDAEGTILMVMEKIRDIPKAQQGAILSSLFGSESLGAIQPLLENLDTLKNAFGAVSDEQSFAGSMAEEYASRSQTTGGSLDRLRRAMESLGIVIGTVLLPPITTVAEMSVALLTPVIKLAEEYPQVTTVVFGVAGALAALKVAGLATAYASTFLSDGWTIFRGILAKLHPRILLNKAAMAAYRVECVALSAAKKGLIIVKKIYGAVISKNRIRLAQITKATLRARAATLLQAAAAKVGAAGIGLLNISFRAYNAVVSLNRIRLSQITAAMVRARAATLLQAAATKVAAVGTRLLNFAMTANPIGALIRLVMLLAIGLVTLYKTCEPVRLVMDNLWGGIKAAASGVFNYLYTNFEFFAAAVEKLGRAWAKLKGWLGFGDEETPSDFTITTAEEKIAAAEAESAAATQPASSGMAFETVADTHTVAASGTALQPGAMEMPESLQADSLEVDDLEGLDLAMSGMDMPDVGSMDMAVPDIAGLQAQPAPQIQAPVTQEFSFNMNFTGMPDKEFAQRVVEAIKLQRSALQEPIAKIVADIMSRQKRLAYD